MKIRITLCFGFGASFGRVALPVLHAVALLGHAAALLPPARVLCALSAASSEREVKPAAD